MNKDQVLIVGAGPTGLALALFLAKSGVIPRIIDKNSGPGQASRAMAVQARTLEFYRQAGFADEVVSKGIPIESLYMRAGGRFVTEVAMGDIGKGQSAFPFVLSYPQDDHERLLVEHLIAEGVSVEWNTELVGADDSADGMEATLAKSDNCREMARFSYICGCDGAHSAVRRAIHLDFPGGTYDQTFFVADVEAVGDAASCHRISFCVGGPDFLLVLPVRSTGMSRLIGIVPASSAAEESATFENVRPFAEHVAGIHVDKVNWFSTYRVHHRVAGHFRVGHAFICGDAGHIHSPAGGQGMNTGIGDAVNLAWKLAAVIQQRADPSILETYEPERIAFARSLVATTDKIFQIMTGSGVADTFFRDTIFPHLVPFALGFEVARSAAFRSLSQARINYRDSPLSEGKAGNVHGGDRLPWIAFDGTDNFEPLRSLDWQIHVYGLATESIRSAASDRNIALLEYRWGPGMSKAGFARDAVYLVRPDGYVSLADDKQDTAKLMEHIAKFKLRQRPIGRE